MKTRESIDFIYVNAAHIDPFKRVIPASVSSTKHSYYDRLKYLEMMLDVTETTLGVFGFSRKQLGFSSASKGYFEETVTEREQEIISELQSLSRDNKE